MPTRRASFRSHRFTRILRTSAARRVLAVVLAPLLILGAFGGSEFLVHVDDHHGLHLHAVEFGQVGPGGAVAPTPDSGPCAHECFPGHDHSTLADSDSGHPCSVPGGVPVSVPDHEQVSARATATLRSACMFTILMAADLVSPMAPDAPVGSLTDPLGSRPRDLMAVTSRDRLVRTSCALLI